MFPRSISHTSPFGCWPCAVDGMLHEQLTLEGLDILRGSESLVVTVEQNASSHDICGVRVSQAPTIPRSLVCNVGRFHL